jgi:signal transduction histidine kinase/CheY-like chemotaxis protein
MGEPNFELLFRSAPGLYLVLDEGLKIVAVSDAYLRATSTRRESVLGRGLFEVFPDNPDDPRADGVRNLKASLERVLASGQPDAMAVQKYDIPREGGGFELRYWSPRNFPVKVEGRVVSIIHRVEDVTEYVALREGNVETLALRSRMEAEILARSRELHHANAELRETQARLKVLNEELEARVAQRTRELETANAERQAAEEQFRQAQKMEAVGQLAGGVAHDFNNLLTIMFGCVDALKDEPLSDAGKTDLENIEQAAKRAAGLTRQLLTFSRRNVISPVVLDLNEVVRHSEAILKRLIGEHIELSSVCEEGIHPVLADRGLIEQAIMNLVLNARDAMPSGGKVTIETMNTELDEHMAGGQLRPPPGRYVMVAVTDTGVGMSAETQERIFLPFFTTKAVGRGTGLGLSMVHGAVKQSRGEIHVSSSVGKGTTFKIYLPVTDGVPVSPVAVQVIERPTPPTETVLLVEDEEKLRVVGQRALGRAGYTVVTAGTPGEALAWCKANTTRLHLVLTDVVMPEMDGPSFIEELSKTRADIKVLFMSGYTGGALAHQRVLEAHDSFLQKPFTPQMLLARVREALERPERWRLGPG